jgi:HlyD family secretion protein
MKIFPKEIIDNTMHSYIPKNEVKSRIIYGLVLLLGVSSLVSLPFIKVQIYSSAKGQVKTDKERIAITSLNSGKVSLSNLMNNKRLAMGDTILVLQTNNLDQQILLNQHKAEELHKEINDLKYLVSSKGLELEKMVSPKYRRELIEFKEKLEEHLTRYKKLEIDVKRNEKLISKGVIAQVEFDNTKLEFDLARSALFQLKKRHSNAWQATWTDLNNSLVEIENQSVQFVNSKMDHLITAPISGTLFDVVGLEKGSFISSGSVLGEITPSSELIAECYVSPLDIGLIDDSNRVNFQIDAFNYNQWGLASGEIIEISEDVAFIENRPFYKVRCTIDQEFLQLKNGAKGVMGKGMTLNARFLITERTLYQLLYDKWDDWLNPGRNPERTMRE